MGVVLRDMPRQGFCCSCFNKTGGAALGSCGAHARGNIKRPAAFQNININY